MASRAEFVVQSAYTYDTSSPARWVWSHVWRYKRLFSVAILGFLVTYFCFSFSRVLIGYAAEAIINPTESGALLSLGFALLVILMLDSAGSLLTALCNETIAQRLERDGRQELYEALLAKSQVWHDRQRVGDIMARATDDMRQMNGMINPGVLFIMDTVMGLTMPLLMIGATFLELTILPLLFIALYIVSVRRYSRVLQPVVGAERQTFGVMNAGLEESISGIEVVKASARESFEREKFRKNATAYRDWFAKRGRTEARYLPMLFYAVLTGAVFLHGIWIYARGEIGIPQIIIVMGLVGVMRFPVFVSIWSFSLFQLGLSSAARVLEVINAKTDLDENLAGHSAQVEGRITFENVSFAFEDGKPVLQDLSFEIMPGQTVAIVGQTGSGKSTLTDLINRTYDVTAGRILIDGVDVREWNLASLRSQISRIEQDVFLFSRTIGENVAFGAPNTPQEQIEQAAREAQAHDFISGFNNGYQTVVGERGVTLSGGQRQRIALARAFLSNPRVLVLDDSTSAIDSATEDEIQKALLRAQEGRTTLLITHRLSQIRWADRILVLDQGKLIAHGTHDEMLRTSAMYRRIFARYDAPLPPLEVAPTETAAD